MAEVPSKKNSTPDLVPQRSRPATESLAPVYPLSRSFSNRAAETSKGKEAAQTEKIPLSTVLRINHFASFLLYFGCAVFWIVCIVNWAQSFSVTENIDFFLRIDNITLGDVTAAPSQSSLSPRQNSDDVEEWLLCPVQDAIAFFAVDDGEAGICAATVGPDGSAGPSALAGCDVDITFMKPASLEGGAEYCKDLCRCSATTGHECVGFSVIGNSSSMTCQLHTTAPSCAVALPGSARVTVDSARALLNVTIANKATNLSWNASTMDIQTVDGTTDALCFSKRNTCNTDCLGQTCDELSLRLGVPCGYVDLGL